MAGTVLIAAGGTGGHLFPAEALAHALVKRGYAVELVTDHRAAGYGGDFPAQAVHIVASATLSGKSPAAAARFAFRLLKGYLQSRSIVARMKPVAAVGFGGYPTVPPLLAAAHMGVPVLLHDANAVLGRANRLLARSATRVATCFAQTRHLAASAKTVVTGNPVRPRVIAAASLPGPADDGKFHLLVFGGSQGARVFADLVPPALELLDPGLKSRLVLVQQVRAEDMERVQASYGRIGIAYTAEPFFADLPERIAASHLVIGRSGGGTCAELCVIGRASVLVPLPHALDNDQKTNAQQLEQAGAAILAEQAGLAPAVLAGMLTGLMQDPAQLAGMAAAAKRLGRPDAVERLADEVVAMARG